MEAIVHQFLKKIENEEKVHILFACESGSRAWGFESTDSDYDVRFIYLRQSEWYLSIDIENKSDIIERDITNNLDVSGWDLRKALNLLYNSNPTLFEWMNSPIEYVKYTNFFNNFKELAKNCYSPKKAFYHYSHMANKNYKGYLKGDTVRLKKYLYVLRPILAGWWIISMKTPIPMKFSELVDFIIVNPNLKNDINQLVEEKKSGFESKYGPKIDTINNFIEGSLEEFEKYGKSEKIKKRDSSIKDLSILNDFFKDTLTKFQPG